MSNRKLVRELSIKEAEVDRISTELMAEAGKSSDDVQKEIVKETTGYIIGSIPAFGWQPPNFRSFLEASLLNEPILGTGAGQWGEEIMITPENLVKASGALVVNLTDREKLVLHRRYYSSVCGNYFS